MTPRPRPLTGMVLGLLLGLVVVGLLWQLAVIDPGRTVLFGLVAIAMILVTLLLTREAAAARGRVTTVAVLAGLLGGVALTGIPELVSAGSISDGCTLEATVDGTTYAPASTAALTPLDVPADAVVEWTATSATPVSVEQRVAGVMIGGFAIPIRTVTSQGAVEGQEISGQVDVAAGVDWIADRTWLEPTGVYHAYGEMSGGSVTCLVEGYVAVAPAGAFATNTLVILWAALAVLVVLIVWAAIVVWRSFRGARRARDDERRAVENGTADREAAELAAFEEQDTRPIEHVAPAPAWTPGTGQPVVPAEEIAAPPSAAREERADASASPRTGPDDTATSSRASRTAPAAGAWAADDAVDGSGSGEASSDQAAASPSGEEGPADDELVADEDAGAEPELLDEEPEDETGEVEPVDEELSADEETAGEEPEDEERETGSTDAEPAEEQGEPVADDEDRIVPEDAEHEDGVVAEESPEDDEGPEPTSEDEGSGPEPVRSA
ncbi:hypothetical protein [Demequina subtropica]|uniref:hypothetical protein n=1 Tax=Demequina subtropica TaxID=1638989 RepID=UPI000AAA368C|nr:hypothetical protein [Demequina subtropica]